VVPALGENPEANATSATMVSAVVKLPIPDGYGGDAGKELLVAKDQDSASEEKYETPVEVELFLPTHTNRLG
jgi:hypothetical protein